MIKKRVLQAMEPLKKEIADILRSYRDYYQEFEKLSSVGIAERLIKNERYLEAKVIDEMKRYGDKLTHQVTDAIEILNKRSDEQKRELVEWQAKIVEQIQNRKDK